jgi:hypothetical protein
MQRTPTSRKSGSNAPHCPFNLTLCEAPYDQQNESLTGQAQKKPRGEQLLDRIDKNPNDREAWNELARGSPTKLAKRKAPAQRETG